MASLSSSTFKTVVVGMFVSGVIVMGSSSSFAEDKSTSAFEKMFANQRLSEADAETASKKICSKKPEEVRAKCESDKYAELMGAKSDTVKCEAAEAKYTEALEKYVEKCEEAGFDSKNCFKEADKCKKAMEDEGKKFSYSGEDDGDDEDSCKERYSACPALAALSRATLKENQKDAKDLLSAEEDAIFDMQDKVREQEAELADIMQENKNIQIKLQKVISEASRALEAEGVKRQAEAAGRLAKSREENNKIMAAFADNQDKANQEILALEKQADSIQDQCEAKADAAFENQKKIIAARKATGTHVQTSVNALTTANKRRAQMIRTEYKFCMTKDSTKAKMNRLDQTRALLLAKAQSNQTLLERQQAEIMQQTREASAIEALAADTATKHLAQKLEEAKSDAMMETQALMTKQTAKQASIDALKQRLKDKESKLGEMKVEEKRAARDLKCAKSYSAARTTGESGSGSTSSSSFAGAVSALRMMETRCNNLATACDMETKVKCKKEVDSYTEDSDKKKSGAKSSKTSD